MGRSGLGLSALPRVPAPLTKPDLRFSRLRISHRLHGRLTTWCPHGGRGIAAACICGWSVRARSRRVFLLYAQTTLHLSEARRPCRLAAEDIHVINTVTIVNPAGKLADTD
jgi:hypothetical protein